MKVAGFSVNACSWACFFFVRVSVVFFWLWTRKADASRGMYLDVCFECRMIPGWVGLEGHQSVSGANMRPVHTSNAMKLDLQPKRQKSQCKKQSKWAIKKKTKKAEKEVYRDVGQVSGMDPCQDLVPDGVAGRVKQIPGDLEPLAIHPGLVINVHANNVLVDAQEVDDWMVLVHKDVAAVRDLEDILCGEVGGCELSIVHPPLHGLLVALTCFVEGKWRVHRGVGNGGESVLVPSVNHLIAREAVDADAKGDSECVVALKEGCLGYGNIPEGVGCCCKVSIQHHAAASRVGRGCIVNADGILSAKDACVLAFHWLPGCCIGTHHGKSIHGALSQYMSDRFFFLLVCVCVLFFTLI